MPDDELVRLRGVVLDVHRVELGISLSSSLHPSSNPNVSNKETPYLVHCPIDGPVFLSKSGYDAQMDRPDRAWRCPHCGNETQWDDDNFEDSAR